MIKKIDIAGLQLDNYTVREMIMRVDRRISEKILTTIEEVNMDTLALAESDEEDDRALLPQKASHARHALLRLRRFGILRPQPIGALPFYGNQNLLLQLPRSLLQARNARKDSRGHAFFRPTDAVCASRRRDSPCDQNST